VRGVPATVVAGLRVAGGDRVLTRVLLAAGGAGVALAVVELLTPAWLAELTGTRQAGAATYALVAAAGFAVDALGSALGPVLVRRCGAPARAAAVATTVGALGLALVGLAGAAGLRGAGAVVIAAVAYCLLFAGLGAAAPAQGQMLHDRVGAAARATVVSVQSLLLQLAAAAGVTVLGWLAGRHGLWTGFAVGAAVLLASAVLFVRLPSVPAVAAHDPLGNGGGSAGDADDPVSGAGEPAGDGDEPVGRAGIR
jgi:MFS family permease